MDEFSKTPTPNDPFSENLDNPRTLQQGITPTGVAARLLGNFIKGFPAATDLGTTFTVSRPGIANNAAFSSMLTFSDTEGKTLFAQPDVAVYVTSIASANQVLGETTTYNQTNVRWMHWMDWGNTDNANMVSVVSGVNLTGGAADFLVTRRIRYFVNPLPPLSGSNS